MKSIFGILFLIVIISIMPFVFAEIPYDQKVKQKIKIQVGTDGNAHVIHDITMFCLL